MNPIKKFSFKYLYAIEEGFKIRMKDGDRINFLVCSVIALVSSLFFTNNIIIHKDIDIFSAILIFVGIIIGFLMTVIVLYTTLANNDYLNNLRTQKFESEDKKSIELGKYQITKFDYILINLFYVVGIGLLLSALIIILLVVDYLKIYNLDIVIKSIQFLTTVKFLFSFLFIFLLFYFIMLIFRVTSIIYKILLIMNYGNNQK